MNPLDSHRVTFISCVNDERLYAICLRELQGLEVPPGVAVDHVAVRGARSMTAGYNTAMRGSNAKYKVYLHQDVFVANKRFLYDLIALFERDSGLGMVGMVGTAQLPPNGVWWEGDPKYGAVFEQREGLQLLQFNPVHGAPQPVKAIDGLLMATQVDLPWNECIEGFHFYDTAHSMDFRRAGYRVAVPDQGAAPWVLHACGTEWDEPAYNRYRQRFLELYC